MRLCIYGAGAVGGHLAAKLAAHGHEVGVIARGRNLAALRESGIKLRHGDREIAGRVRAAEDPAELGAQDLVIVALKANALAGFARNCAPLLKSDTPVVFAQNGIPWWYAIGLSAARPAPPDLSRLDPDGALRKAIEPRRIVGAVVYSANDQVEPGRVVNHTPGNNMVVLGECDDRNSPALAKVRQMLEAADISSPASADIRQVLWNKLVSNIGTGTLCLLAGATVADVRRGALGKVSDQVMAEVRAVAKAHDVDADGAPRRPSGGPSSGPIAHKPSILQDYERGRPMEIEAQLAMPLAFGRTANIATPILDALAALAVHKAAAKGLYTT
jgi:2-dehydropantoate 2-reductase